MDPNPYQAPRGSASPPAGRTSLPRLTPVQWVFVIVAVSWQVIRILRWM